MAKKKASKRPRAKIEDVLGELGTLGVEVSKLQAAMAPVVKLNETLQQLQPTMNQLLGELRAVRILLDEKKQYAFMDKPRPNLDDQRQIPERLGG